MIKTIQNNIIRHTLETPLGAKRDFFLDISNNREYRRVVGGVAWPYKEQQGFLCVIGESDHVTHRMRTRFNYLLAESQINEIDKLIKQMYDIQNKYLVQTWYSDTENLTMMHFVDKFNEKLPRGKKGIYITDAAFMDDSHNLRLYNHLIRSQTIPSKKKLYFGDQSRIPSQLNEISPDDTQTKKAECFPVVAALGYVLSGLDEPYTEISREREMQQIYFNKQAVEGL